MLNLNYIHSAFLAVINTNYPLIKWHPSKSAPNSYKELKAFKSGVFSFVESLPVYDGDSGQTVYQCSENNVLFRAWHDLVHLQYDFDFSIDGEIKTATIQKEQLLKLGYSLELANLVYLDVVAQAFYYFKTKQYVKNQIEFMNKVLKHLNGKTDTKEIQYAVDCILNDIDLI